MSKVQILDVSGNRVAIGSLDYSLKLRLDLISSSLAMLITSISKITVRKTFIVVRSNQFN